MFLRLPTDSIETRQFLASVDFRSDNKHRLFCKLGTEARQFRQDYVKIVRRIPAAEIGNIHQVDQKARPLYMPQKPDAKAMPFVRALDQTGNVGQNERSVTRLQLRPGSARAS